MKPAYLIAGDDSAKIATGRSRLRRRAEDEGGAAALQVFESTAGKGAPDAEAVARAITTLSLTESRRYLMVDGVERWREAQAAVVATAIELIPEELTIVLIARGKAPPPLVTAVEAAGGEVLTYQRPRPREMPKKLVSTAQRLGFRLDPGAARMLVDRMGTEPMRLERELERLALWAGKEGVVTAADLEAMVADTSEAAVWGLSDALLDRDPARTLEIAERLLSQGENVTGLVYALSSRLRKAQTALTELEAGAAPKQVEAGLGMHPYAARQLVGRLRDVSLEELRRATEALADLEVWCRGGADYGDPLALTLALRRAAGGAV
jgi:DNA polymerase-3 subunit delta